MEVIKTKKFRELYDQAPVDMQRRFEKQASFLLQDFRHPSLRTKIWDKKKRVWQARVDGGWRFYFQVRADTIYLLTIGPHPK